MNLLATRTCVDRHALAVSLVLLTGATLLMTSFVRLMARDLGFEPRHLMTFGLSLPSVRYSVDRQPSGPATGGV